MHGDSPYKASSPKPATSPDNQKPPSTKSGRGRPTSDSVRVPWQVLELAGSSASAAAGESLDDQVKKPVEEGSPRKMVTSHKRKHSLTTLPPVSPTKSPIHQQEAPHDDHSPASGGGDITAVKNSCEEKAKMEAGFAVVSRKEKVEVDPSNAAEGKNIEEPCADADEDLESSEAFAVEEYVDDDYESCDDDDAVTSKINKEMILPVEEETDDEEEKKEIVGENSCDEEKKKNKDETFEADNNQGEKDKKEAFETVAREKKHEAPESSDAVEKCKMKFPFDLNELPSVADDEDEGVMP